jgi:hypothetical protein
MTAKAEVNRKLYRRSERHFIWDGWGQKEHLSVRKFPGNANMSFDKERVKIKDVS